LSVDDWLSKLEKLKREGKVTPEVYSRLKSEYVKRPWSSVMGIDFGTCYSTSAIVLGGRPQVIPQGRVAPLGGKGLSSFVATDDYGRVLVGEEARTRAVIVPNSATSYMKRTLAVDQEAFETGETGGQRLGPKQATAAILKELGRRATAFSGHPASGAVVSTPSGFNMRQRKSLLQAATMAGFDSVRIVNEATAASLAYWSGKGSDGAGKIMEVDVGSGKLDITISDFRGGVLQVLSTGGDARLGGIDLDQTIMNYLSEAFHRETGINLRLDPQAMLRLAEAAERARLDLSSGSPTAYVYLPRIGLSSDLRVSLDRNTFRVLIEPILDRLKRTIRATVKSANLESGKIEGLVLSGGLSRMPLVRSAIEESSDLKALGGIDPAECVAIGCAAFGSVLAGEKRDLILLDIIDHSLSLQLRDGCVGVVGRNTTIPTRREVKIAGNPDREDLTVHVLEGEANTASENVSLGTFMLHEMGGSERALRVEVVFDIDASGRLKVSVRGRGEESSKTREFPCATESFTIASLPTLGLARATLLRTEDKPKCIICGRPMSLMDENTRRWYCLKDDQAYFAREDRWDPTKEKLERKVEEAARREESFIKAIPEELLLPDDREALMKVPALVKPLKGRWTRVTYDDRTGEMPHAAMGEYAAVVSITRNRLIAQTSLRWRKQPGGVVILFIPIPFGLSPKEIGTAEYRIGVPLHASTSAAVKIGVLGKRRLVVSSGDKAVEIRTDSPDLQQAYEKNGLDPEQVLARMSNIVTRTHVDAGR